MFVGAGPVEVDEVVKREPPAVRRSALEDVDVAELFEEAEEFEAAKMVDWVAAKEVLEPVGILALPDVMVTMEPRDVATSNVGVLVGEELVEDAGVSEFDEESDCTTASAAVMAHKPVESRTMMLSVKEIIPLGF